MSTAAATPVNDFIHISRVFPHPANVREQLTGLTELADSIRVHGILQPLVVQPHPQRPGCYVVLAGHRRLEAARRAGLEEVPAVVRQAASYDQAIEVMLVENLQRADLNPMDKAEALGRLRHRGYSVAQITDAISISDAAVYQYLALLELDQASRQKIRDGELTKTDAVAAIQRTRKHRRARRGQANRSTAIAATWEPDHFTWQHPLAKRAAGVCAAREHNRRRRVGKVACGQCWETVIRADERTVAAVAGPDGHGREAGS